jgi:muramoyltetrapeptide carboxypeptidase
MTSLTLFSPAGVVPHGAALRLARQRLRGLGFDAQLDEAALARHQRFAGDDETRLAALHRVAQAAPSVPGGFRRRWPWPAAAATA